MTRGTLIHKKQDWPLVSFALLVVALIDASQPKKIKKSSPRQVGSKLIQGRQCDYRILVGRLADLASKWWKDRYLQVASSRRRSSSSAVWVIYAPEVPNLEDTVSSIHTLANTFRYSLVSRNEKKCRPKKRGICDDSLKTFYLKNWFGQTCFGIVWNSYVKLV